MLRAIREIQPRWVLGENVRGIVNWNGGMVFEQVLADLEDAGYEVTPYLVPACGVGAPHRRDRVWFVAKHSDSQRLEKCDIPQKPGEQNISCVRLDEDAFDSESSGCKGECEREQGEIKFDRRNCEDLQARWSNFPTQSPVRSRDDGFPIPMDGIAFSNWRNESIKAYGNAIVPQLAYRFFEAMKYVDKI